MTRVYDLDDEEVSNVKMRKQCYLYAEELSPSFRPHGVIAFVQPLGAFPDLRSGVTFGPK